MLNMSKKYKKKSVVCLLALPVLYAFSPCYADAIDERLYTCIQESSFIYSDKSKGLKEHTNEHDVRARHRYFIDFKKLKIYRDKIDEKSASGFTYRQTNEPLKNAFINLKHYTYKINVESSKESQIYFIHNPEDKSSVLIEIANLLVLSILQYHCSEGVIERGFFK